MIRPKDPKPSKLEKLTQSIFFQDVENSASPDGGPSNGVPPVPSVPKKCEKAVLARVWGNFDKK